MSLVGPRPERPELLENLAMAIPFFEERTRGVKPGLTGLAQISLGYSGGAGRERRGREAPREPDEPVQIDEAEGALADDMRIKLMFDLAYAAALERLAGRTCPMELQILVKTPVVMVMSRGAAVEATNRDIVARRADDDSTPTRANVRLRAVLESPAARDRPRLDADRAGIPGRPWLSQRR